MPNFLKRFLESRLLGFVIRLLQRQKDAIDNPVQDTATTTTTKASASKPLLPPKLK